jgi:hypothetical protein
LPTIKSALLFAILLQALPQTLLCRFWLDVNAIFQLEQPSRDIHSAPLLPPFFLATFSFLQLAS